MFSKQGWRWGFIYKPLRSLLQTRNFERRILVIKSHPFHITLCQYCPVIAEAYIKPNIFKNIWTLIMKAAAVLFLVTERRFKEKLMIRERSGETILLVTCWVPQSLRLLCKPVGTLRILEFSALWVVSQPILLTSPHSNTYHIIYYFSIKIWENLQKDI